MTTLASRPAFIIDGIIVLLLLEMIVLTVYRSVRGRGLRPSELASFLGAGLALLLGLRVIATEGSFVHFGAVMLAAFGLHVWHVVQRWQR